MTNGFYNDAGTLTANQLARASAVVAELQSVEAGFDKLPTETELKQGATTYAADTGTANTYVVTLPYAPASYAAGLFVVMKVLTTNTGASTFNASALGAIALNRSDGTATVAGDLVAGQIVLLGFDGTGMRLLSASLAEIATALAAAEAAQAAAEAAQAAAEAALASIPTADVTTVAGISADVTTVAGISADVTTVAGSVSGVGALASIAGLTTAADRMIYTTASDTYAVATLTSAGRALLDDADASAQRTTLGLGTIATQDATSVSGTTSTFETVRAEGATPAFFIKDTGNGTNLKTWRTNVDSSGSYVISSMNDSDEFGQYAYFITRAGTTVDRHEWVINASAKMDLTSTGLGINRFTPTAALDVNGTAKVSGALTASTSVTTPLVTNAGTLALSATGANVIALATNGSEAMRITSSGNVGIGTSSPSQRVSIVGTGSVYQSVSNGTATSLQGVTAGNVALVGTISNHALTLYTNNQERARIDSAGNMGIGTTNVETPLHVQNNNAGASASGLLLQNRSSTIATEVGIDFIVNATDLSDGRNARIAAVNTDGSTARALTFSIGAAGAAATEAVRITSSGNVGIGTSSPTQKLDVYGVIRSTGGFPSLYINESDQLVDEKNWRISSSSADFSVQTLNDAETSAVNGYVITRGTGTTVDSHRFYVGSGSEKMRIDSSGNLLVGKTSSNISTAGSELLPTGSSRFVTGAGITPMAIHRLADDGTLIVFLQGGTTEGDISVSGTTVSYNAFAGSHWSRFENGATPEVLIGTLIESTGEQLTWPGEADEKHTFGRICNTVQSRAVAGVFMAYDTNDEHGDFYCTAVGRYLMRVSAGEDPQVGDLLEANGKYARISSEQNIQMAYHVARVMGTSGSNHAADDSFCVAVELMIGG